MEQDIDWMGFHDFWTSQMCRDPSWRDEFPDVYAAAEAYIHGAAPGELTAMLRELDELTAMPSEADRRRALPTPLEDIGDEPGALDAFLVDFRARVVREQARDRRRPLVDPRPPRTGPLSPQGWDVTLPSAGSFPTEGVAQAVVDAVLARYADRVRDALAPADGAVPVRLPPLRMRFDKDVGTVVLRDGPTLRTRNAVVLLHAVDGTAQVLSAFPMEPVPEPPQLPALFRLLGGWLHADWVDEQPGTHDPLEQVRRFAAAEPVDTVRQAAVELEALLGSGTEDERREAVRGLCCYFVPRPSGQLDAFLAAAADVLAAR
jgi:hypothetical protein